MARCTLNNGVNKTSDVMTFFRSVMDIQNVTLFFMWCSVINGSLLTFWTLACSVAPDMVYRLQSKWFPISRDQYNMAMYAFLGLFKVMFLTLNLVPYIALRIIN